MDKIGMEVQKAKVKNATMFINANTEVVLDRNKETKELTRGKTGMILAAIPAGGSLFFHEDNLTAI